MREREKEKALGEVCRQLESLRMAMTRDRSEERVGREKSLIINTEVGRENSTVFRERTRTMTRRRGRLRRSRPNGHGLAPGKTLLAKRRESVQRLSLGFKKLLITWIFSSVPPRCVLAGAAARRSCFYIGTFFNPSSSSARSSASRHNRN